MTTQEEVEAIKELDELYERAKASGRKEDWERYTEARWAFERRRAA